MAARVIASAEAAAGTAVTASVRPVPVRMGAAETEGTVEEDALAEAAPWAWVAIASERAEGLVVGVVFAEDARGLPEGSWEEGTAEAVAEVEVEAAEAEEVVAEKAGVNMVAAG